MNKYKIGDKVIVNIHSKRLPVWIRDSIRHNRVRTIVHTYYDSQTQHTRYYLGGNKMGLDFTFQDFRAEELIAWKKRRTIGRPRQKRKYKKGLVAV